MLQNLTSFYHVFSRQYWVPSRCEDSLTLLHFAKRGYSQQVPYTYLGSFLFSSHTKAQNVWLFHNFILGILGPIAIFILMVTVPEDKRAVGEAFLALLRLFPQISFSFALIWLGFTNAIGGVESDDDFSFDPFSKEIRTSLIYLACEAVGYSILVLLLERYGAGRAHCMYAMPRFGFGELQYFAWFFCLISYSGSFVKTFFLCVRYCRETFAPPVHMPSWCLPSACGDIILSGLSQAGHARHVRPAGRPSQPARTL